MPSGGIVNTHPLFQQDYIDGVMDSYFPSDKQYVVMRWFPAENLNVNEIKWDEESPLNYGLTKPVAPGAESPIIQAGAAMQFSMTPGHFREKYVLRREDLVALRKMGTLGEMASGREVMSKRLLHLRERIQDRLEWLGWNAIFGTITVNENNVNYTLTYPLPSEYNVTKTGADAWDQPSTANPINDIMDMVELTETFGFRYGSMWMNHATAKTALQIQQFRSLFDSAVQGGRLEGTRILAMDTLTDVLKLHIPGVPEIVVWNHGYRLQETITADAAPAATSVVLDDVTHIAVGDEMTFISKDSTDQQKVTVTTVTAATKTVDFTPALAAGPTYSAGSYVRLFKHYIPEGKVLFMPELSATVPSIGKTYFTPTEWKGGLMNPQAGIFTAIHAHEMEDPPRIELIAGFSGAPVPLYRNTHAILTVY